MYLEFGKSAPDTPLMPELQLAVAATYERENQWANAIEQYDRCLAVFTNSSAWPRAEYYRAWATTYLAGQETNALTLFTNFIAQFPTNELAPRRKCGWPIITTARAFRARRSGITGCSFRIQIGRPRSDL